jgi:phosphomannomutase
MMEGMATGSLRSKLNYEPVELQFGTSGRRGKVVDLTQLEVYINSLAELEYLQSLDAASGGIARGDDFFFALDLRPSSTAIAQAIAAAIVEAGMTPVNLGLIPTPALAYYALARQRGSIMITGSHIPFDRNGFKTYSSRGELSKPQEVPINEQVRKVRQKVYDTAFDESIFDPRGSFKASRDLPAQGPDARAAWIDRFTNFFAGASLKGKRLLVYQHSAVGRDILVEILERLHAEVIPAGRSEVFVPIDTENIGAPQLATIQSLADDAAAAHGPIFAVVSTDGDSDRPLVLGVDSATGKVHFFGGDLLGMVVAKYLHADSVVVPITCNDAIDRGELAPVLEAKTRIGSPFVIAAMEQARSKGKKRVCGWEPNGGFLTATDLGNLTALPTRDAMLPILAALFAASESGLALADLFAQLPARFSRAALLPQFPRALGEKVAALSDLSRFFPAEAGFGKISHVDHTDGVRILFDNGDVAHVRPSGNADELRIYAVADTQVRADAIAAMGVAEPDGILRSMAKAAEE